MNNYRLIKLFSVTGIIITIPLVFIITLTEIIGAGEWYHIGHTADTSDQSATVSQRFIKDIEMDEKYIWVATSDGLNRINRNNLNDITVFKNGFIETFISALAVDNTYVWCGTPSGLVRVDKKTGEALNFTTAEGLSGNEINDLLMDGEFLWIATEKGGLTKYDTKANAWEVYDFNRGLLTLGVNCLGLDSGHIWAGSPNGLWMFDKAVDTWTPFGKPFGLSEENIRCLTVDGNYIWCGTHGGGINRFDVLSYRFEDYSTRNSKVIDDYIQSVCIDGQYLWVGTFSGVSMYNKINRTWERNYDNNSTSDGLTENSVSAIDVDGSYIWFGTDGGGLCRYMKQLPEASISSRSRYIRPGVVGIVGTIADEDGIQNFELKWKPTVGTANWSSEGITIKQKENIRDTEFAEWDVSALEEIPHLLRLIVVDNAGQKNQAQVSFVIDNIPPVIRLDPMPETVRQAEQTVSGTFNDFNLKRITIEFGETVQRVKVKQNEWSANVTLNDGINDFTITAVDIAGQEAKKSFRMIYDMAPPQVMLTAVPKTSGSRTFTVSGVITEASLSRIEVLVGEESRFEGKVIATEGLENTFEAEVKLRKGQNTITVIAYDALGQRGSAEAEITFSSEVPTIMLDKKAHKVVEADYDVKGTWEDSDLLRIYVELNDQQIDAEVNTEDKTFSARIVLSPGKNAITVVAEDKAGNSSFEIYEVVYSQFASKMAFDFDSPYFSTKSDLTVQGFYDEPKIDYISIEPLNIRAELQKTNKRFSFPVTFEQPGAQDLKVTLYDIDGGFTPVNYRVGWDPDPPFLEVEEYNKPLDRIAVISGKFSDEFIKNIDVITPVNKFSADLDIDHETFTATVELVDGKNTISIEAFDYAQNKTEKEINVVCVPSVAGGVSVSTSELSNALARIDELEKLVEQLKVFGGGPKVKIPETSALYFVPYDTKSGDTLWHIAQEYLGNQFNCAQIAAYNDNTAPTIIASNKQVLVPTKQLIHKTMLFDGDDIELRVIDIVAESYGSIGKTEDIEQYRDEVLHRLVRQNLINTEEQNGMKGKTEFVVNENIMIVLKSGDMVTQAYKQATLARLNDMKMRSAIIANINADFLELETVIK